MDPVTGLRREAHAAALEEAVRRVLAQLSAVSEVRKVVLFGSFAAGHRDLFTDLEFLVVMESDQPFVDRTAALHRDIRAGVYVDFLAYTPEEFEQMRLRPFVRRILETGRVSSLRDDPLAEGRRWLSQAEADLRRVQHLAHEGGYHLACFLAQQVARKGDQSVSLRSGSGNRPHPLHSHDERRLSETVMDVGRLFG